MGAPDHGGEPGDETRKPERLNKFLALCGVASRRASDDLIAAGRVRINGVVVHEMGSRVDPQRDLVTVDGVAVRPPEKLRYYVLYKPTGYVTTAADPHAEQIAQSLVPSEPRLFSVGRLDADSEGLLLYTNDGEITQKLTHPRYEHPKEYLVLVGGEAPDGFGDRLARGVDIGEGSRLAQGTLSRLPADYNFRGHYAPAGQMWIRLAVREGRKRLVRRMMEATGLQVERLVRVRMGPLRLGSLEPGEGRWLTDDEVRALRRYGREGSS